MSFCKLSAVHVAILSLCFFPKFVFAEVLSTQRGVWSAEVPHIKVELSERKNRQELEKIIFDVSSEDKAAVLSFSLSESKTKSTWAMVKFDSKQITDISFFGFTKDEWNAFAKFGKMYPSDSDLLGLWSAENPHLTKKARKLTSSMVSVYRWKDKTFAYEKYNDGSGVPKEFTEELSGKRDLVLKPVVKAIDYLVITQNGELQFWDDEGESSFISNKIQ